MLSRIPYITLWAKKFGECLAFYKDTLGLEVEYQDENFVQFKTEGTKLYIHRIKENTEPLREHTIEIHFEVEDVDQTYEGLKSKGVSFETQPANMPWGVRVASFCDPEGYVTEIVGSLKQGEDLV